MAIFNGTNINDVYLGTLADDTINGGGGDDYLYGDAGNDIIKGGTGNDTLVGGTGNDTLEGGSGVDSLAGGDDDDTLNGGSSTDYLYGGSGNDNLSGGSDSANDFLYGESGNDNLDGGSGSDYLDGGTGNDTIAGGSGNDTIYGDNVEVIAYGPNLVVNGSFEDPAVADGSYIISSSITGWTSDSGDGIEVENNAVQPASDGLNLVELDSNNNSNMYQDVATGGTGDFLLSFDYSPRPGVDAASNPIEVYWNGVLLDTLTGDAGGFTTKTYEVQGAGATTRLEFRAVGTEDSLGGFLDNVKVQSFEGSNDTIEGGSGNDIIYGGYGNDAVTSGSGNDTVSGGSGNDNIVTGSGLDTVDGGTGDDYIRGDSGADVLTGGADADIFDYNGLGDSTVGVRDLITDFEIGTDHIELIGLGFTGIAAGPAAGTTLGYAFDGTNTIITAAGSDFSIALTGDKALSNTDFFFA